MIEETNLDAQTKFTHYKESTALPMKVVAIGVADFAVRFEGDVDNIPIHSWVYPEDRLKGFFDYGMAAAMMPYFVKNISPYPYKKLASVQSKTIFNGMENAGAIFYPENSITGNRSIEVLMAHEIAHQWFGNMVTETDWAHVWLSEGFATYMAVLYMENKYGKDTAEQMRIEDRMQAIAFSKQKSVPVVDSSTSNYLELLNANSYQKGGWVLHMLRKQLGDTAFWNCIRSYYLKYSGKNAVTDDFRNIAEKVSGKDLKKFFIQWLYTPGHPQLDIQWKYDPVSKACVVTVNQQQSMLFEFPFEIKMEISSQNIFTKAFVIKDKRTTVSIPVPSRPLKMILDPDINLLYEGVVKEIR